MATMKILVLLILAATHAGLVEGGSCSTGCQVNTCCQSASCEDLAILRSENEAMNVTSQETQIKMNELQNNLTLVEEMMETSVIPLQQQIEQLSATVQTQTADKPLAHMYGSTGIGTWTTLTIGTVVTYWYTGTTEWYAPILRGGMTYSGGYITVPKQGIYYVYGKLYFIKGLSTTCGFRIEASGSTIIFTQETQIPSGQGRGLYAGQVIILNAQDTLVMKIQGSCNYYFENRYALFGAFLLDD